MKKPFRYCEIKPFQGKWGVFTLEPLNQKDYVYLIQRSKDKVAPFLCIPMWTDRFKKDMKCLPLKDCVELATNYDEFCNNSEWY